MKRLILESALAGILAANNAPPCAAAQNSSFRPGIEWSQVSVATEVKAPSATPREVVAAWLQAVKDGPPKDAWALCVPDSHAGWSVDLLEVLKTDRFVPLHQLGDDSAAMVLCNSLRDPTGRQVLFLAQLLRQDGQWRIQSQGLRVAESAYTEADGFKAYPGVRYDVQPNELMGRWIVGVCSGSITLNADGTGTFRTSDPAGSVGEATDLHWSVKGDTLALPWPGYPASGAITRVKPDEFTVRYSADSSLYIVREKQSGRRFALHAVVEAGAPAAWKCPMRNGAGQTEWHSLEARPLLDDTALRSAAVGNDGNGKPRIQITFTDAAARQFGEITAKNIGKRLGILIDGRLESAPIVRTAITSGTAVISGNFTYREAEAFVDSVNPKPLSSPIRN
jgi:hypothetical protein